MWLPVVRRHLAVSAICQWGAEAAPSGKSSRAKVQRSLGHYWLATGVFVLALLAKPTAVVVPVVAWVLECLGLAADLA